MIFDSQGFRDSLGDKREGQDEEENKDGDGDEDKDKPPRASKKGAAKKAAVKGSKKVRFDV
jgi:hypothetical protein